MTDLYEHINPSVLGDFEGSGTQALLDLMQADESGDATSVVFTEVLMMAQSELLSIDQITQFLQASITDEESAGIFCCVFDVFPLDQALKNLFNNIYVTHKVITPATVAQCVDTSKLQELDVLPTEAFNRQMNTRKRDQYFTQNKFNLVHEEFEAYSLLVSEFHSILTSENSSSLVDHALDLTSSLIGHYLLDPNRVLDVIIDLCSSHLVGNVDFILAFLKKSPWWPSVEADCVSGLHTLAIGGCTAASSSIALRFLKQPKDTDHSESFKDLVCIFIKEGFVSFGSIYSQLPVTDDELTVLEKLYKTKLDDQVFRASASALSLAAPLSDEGEERVSNKRSDDPVQPPASLESLLKNNAKYQLLKSLLTIGLYWPSIYILSQHPFFAHVDKDISALMHRLLGAIIDPFHKSISPLSPDVLAEFQKERSIATARPMNQVKYEAPVTTDLYYLNPLSRVEGNRKHVFFYSGWTAHLPSLHSPQDLHSLSEQLLKFFGPILASNAPNFIKICDIIICDLEKCVQEQKETWFNFFRNFVFPTIGNIEENAICVDKAYEVLKFFSLEDRFNLYGEMYQVLSKNNPYVKLAYGKAEKATKDVLKRLSKENVKPMMMRLAKISISNPLPCFLAILSQLESYDNLNTLIVQTAAYFNDYGWDNMALAILMRLTASGRSGLQSNGLNDRQWIQSLSSFIGKLCQEYPEAFDLNILSKYLLRSLHSAGTCDLIVLKELLSSMGGLQSITNLTHLQISMINSEPCLENIVYETIGDRRYENVRSGSAMCDVLMKDGMVNEFLVLLCKLNIDTIVGSEFPHLKVLASKKDELDSVTHFLCTLVGFYSKETPSALIPLDELIEKYHTPIAWAFEMWRKFLPSQSHDNVAAAIRDSLPQSVLESLDIDLFLSFWGMSLYDINYSDDLYDSELAKVVSKVSSLKEEYFFARRDKHASEHTLEKFKKSIQENEKLIDVIPQQKDRHKAHDAQKVAALQEKSSNWFSEDAVASARSISSFLENCVLPRCIHSSFDAIYSASAIFKLHEIQAKGYSFISCLNQFFENKILFATLFTCTATEAENLGLFVSAILKKLSTWSRSEVFDKCHAIVGEEGQELTYNEYRKILYRYHGLILEDIQRALSVTTYMSRMNGITFLKNLMGVYPIVEDHCEKFIDLMENISLNEKRDDLKLSSSAMIGHVKSRKAQWVHLWDFVELEEAAKVAHVAEREKIKAREVQKAKEAIELRNRLQEEENRKQREEEEKLLDKEKAEQQRMASLNAIKYEDSSSSRTPTRDISRVSAINRGEAAKDRYQNYANNGSKKTSESDSRDALQSKAPSGPESMRAAANNAAGTQHQDDLFQRKTARRETSKDDRPSDKTSRDDKTHEKKNEGQELPRQGNSLLKAKLEEARREQMGKSTEKSGSPAPPSNLAKKENTSTQGPSSETRVSSPSTQESSSRSQTSSKSQSSSSTSVSSSSTSVSSSRTQASSSKVPPGPRNAPSVRPRAPLPPQRPPPTQPSGGRGGGPIDKARTERTYSSGGAPAPTGRYPANPRESQPSQAAAPRGGTFKPPGSRERQPPIKPPNEDRQTPPTGTQVRARAPLPPQQVPRDNRGNYGRGDGRGDGRFRNGRSHAEKSTSSRNDDPLPPPPVPPPAKRDDPATRKRRFESSGREHDKRQRY